ncbi:hypothetical protein, partial [Natrialba sp. PRR66]|uniref:hypothetical protein n=1 Tax=Natrialba sp. PRR66 TaxID=3098146 RepID=UPI002B1D2A8F
EGVDIGSSEYEEYSTTKLMDLTNATDKYLPVTLPHLEENNPQSQFSFYYQYNRDQQFLQDNVKYYDNQYYHKPLEGHRNPSEPQYLDSK